MEGLPDLRVLVLKSNMFDGNMSLASRSNLPFPKLQVLDISENEFVGSLPQKYLKNFRAMMDAKENQTNILTPSDVDDRIFQGFLEMRITLKGLDQLLKRLLKTFATIDLSSNKFSGTIPHSIEIGFPPRRGSRLFCDNKAAISISENPVQHDRTKHVEIDWHFIKEKLDSGIIELPFIRSDEQLADILTKAVNTKVFREVLDKLSIGNAITQLAGEC
ncbi:receptor like protein 27-like [Salvia miltiorrhiza]|uniref:receptor like protein 27-like n=1 Tax=Salvia miltiorrhiza TaxID=226208 RepID=UPI0025AB9643|nr:receptor like protein 27-like [Salvia miltiorrhiza]